MFSRVNRFRGIGAKRVTRNPFCYDPMVSKRAYNNTSKAPKSPVQWINQLFAAGVGVGIGSLLVNYSASHDDTNHVDTTHDDNTGIAKKHSLLISDSSTSPLGTLETPQYANEAEFKEAVDKISQFISSDKIHSDEIHIDSHSDSFFSTHHPPDPKNQHPGVVITPSNTEEVSKIMKIAHHYRVPVVPSSGLTSLEGHYMHTRGPNTISLSFSLMDSIIDVHPEDLDAIVQPGVGWQELDHHLISHDETKHLMFGPDPGPGAQIGGMIASSCSGTNAYKYGTMKENVINLTVVLADGTIIKTKQRPRKSSAGYDTTRLFIGSEGTLGIITEATLKLHTRPKFELVSIASFPEIKDAAQTAQEIINKSGIHPNAIEILDSTMMSFVNARDNDTSSKKYDETPTLFFKLGGPSKASIDEQIKIINEIAARNNLINFEASTKEEDNSILWAARRNGLWSTIEYGAQILDDKDDVQVWTTDVAVPISNLSKMINETNKDLNDSGFYKKFSVMGHIGDGNCHFLLLYNSKDYNKAQVLVNRMVNRALKFEGTCTGEHGVGIGKRKYLPIELGETTVDFMRHLKLAIDPRRILNPDKVISIDKNDDLDAKLDAGHIIEHKPCCH